MFAHFSQAKLDEYFPNMFTLGLLFHNITSYFNHFPNMFTLGLSFHNITSYFNHGKVGNKLDWTQS